MSSFAVSPTSPWFDTVPDRREYASLDRAIVVDVAIVGGGIVGVIAAHVLASEGRRIALVERNHLATGDTGYTTAFLTRVPDASAADLRRRHGGAFVRQLFDATRDAQRFVRKIIEERGIACDLVSCRSFNGVYSDDDPSLEEEWEAVRDAADGVALLGGGDVPTDARPFRKAIVFEDEARFHIRKFLAALLRPSTPALRVFEETDVRSLSVSGDHASLETEHGSVRAPLVVLACGDPSSICPELAELVSARLTFALAARFDAGVPFADHLFWDCEAPYQYFRRMDSATAIVGGADRDASAAPSGPGDPHDTLRAFVRRRLGGDFSVTHQWSGSLFETSDGLPYVAPHPHHGGRVIVATGFSGNGMVMGALGGRLAANLALGRQDPMSALFDFARTGTKIAVPALAATPPQASSDSHQGVGHALKGLFDGGKSSAPSRPTFAAVGTVNDLPVGKGKCVKVEGHEIALFNVDGRVYAVDNKCSHSGGPLCKGPLKGTEVTCPWHGSKFDVTNGAVTVGPARTPVATYETRVEGSDIEVHV